MKLVEAVVGGWDTDGGQTGNCDRHREGGDVDAVDVDGKGDESHDDEDEDED